MKRGLPLEDDVIKAGERGNRWEGDGRDRAFTYTTLYLSNTGIQGNQLGSDPLASQASREVEWSNLTRTGSTQDKKNKLADVQPASNG
ncbi:hypothetical protein RRG08_002889 [Elysia crispata]|uniref:Uncharacterized protein n=1 Tax=Elysia crispata TaxID=231223 RepID=A0AAE0YKT2_9GAST|nr:hypothetical protein RRG08_002889 [Elysia crispata]